MKILFALITTLCLFTVFACVTVRPGGNKYDIDASGSVKR